MNLAPMIAIITAFVLLIQHQVTTRYHEQIIVAEADTAARNMMVYRNAVSAYLTANPGASGTIADAALSLPTWFAKYSGITNTISGGVIFTYTATPPAGLAPRLMAVTNNTATVGIKTGGVLINPLSTTNLTIPIAIPPAIPNGALVIAG